MIVMAKQCQFQLPLLLLLYLISPNFITAGRTSIHVYTTSVTVGSSTASAVSRKQQFDLQQQLGHPNVQVYAYDSNEQEEFVSSTCPKLTETYQGSNKSMRDEIFKWCVLANPTADRTIVLDSESPIVSLQSLATVIITENYQGKRNTAVRDERLGVIHGSFIQMDRASASFLPQTMLDFIADTDKDLLNHRRAMLLPKKLYEEMDDKEWHFLSLECDLATLSESDAFTCAEGFCCSIQDAALSQTLLFNRHYVYPPRLIQDDSLKHPFAATISVEKFLKPPDAPKTPNLYEILKEKKCIPDNEKCFMCLREKKGATCKNCAAHCSCFCSQLCATKAPEKHVAERWTIALPKYEREPDRLIPRIVHQTWYEELSATKYPNMSRMVESFRQSGWDYRFYTDDTAESFLSEHFPPSVLQAYQVLKPGAFKADLFRYCVLLIHGGVYADVDIQLESALDISIPPDVAFVVPLDEPGRPVGKQMCLWNGLIASVPGHPFLAQSIETIVNQVRNRFTSIDIDAGFCPNPELSILHAYDTLFTAGPCLLGASLNRVMKRNLQQSHVPGSSEHGFGRTIILHQNKWDMGAHRFTNIEQNLVVAATDLPDGDDVANAAQDPNRGESKNNQHPHYSTAHAKNGIYGLTHLYDPNFVAVDEVIRIQWAHDTK